MGDCFLTGMAAAQRPLHCHPLGMYSPRCSATCVVYSKGQLQGPDMVQSCRPLHTTSGSSGHGISHQSRSSELYSMSSSHNATHRSRSCVSVQCVQALERPPPSTTGPSTSGSPASRGPSTSLHGPATWMDDIELPKHDERRGKVELVVAGAGPSGLAVAERVSKAGQCVLIYPCVA